MQRVLHEEEGRLHVGIEELVVACFGRVPDGAAVGEGRGVDECIDPSEGGIAGGHDRAHVRELHEVGLDKDGLHLLGFECGLHLGPALGVAAGDDHLAHATVGEEVGDGFAQPLRGARDDGGLAVHGEVLEALDIHLNQLTFTGLPVFHDSVAASASFWACRPSVPEGATGLLLVTASMKVSTSLA